MTLLERLQSLFRRKPTEAVADAPPPEIANSATPTVVSEALQQVAYQAMADDEPLPHWLSSEEALRDEGVIFGLSQSDMDEKVAVIRTYFSHQTADIAKEIERLSEKIGELNLFIEQREQRMEALTTKGETLAAAVPADHNLLRTAVGLLLALGMCVANYFLIANSLVYQFPETYGPVALGVLFAGYFTLFSRYSLFHETTSKLTWRKALEEFGMPAAGALFVFVQVLDKQPLPRALALLGFVFFLFLMAGKLVLSNLTLLKTDWQLARQNRQLHAERKQHSSKADEEMEALKKEIDELRVQKWQILPELSKMEAAMARYDSKRDSLIKLFESEFKLARSYRDKLTATQLRKIL